MPDNPPDFHQQKTSSHPNIGIVLLAAGGSTRLGHPKQLLLYKGRTLLNHCLQVATTSNASQIIVVLGSQSNTIKNRIEEGVAHVVLNEDWQEGMASSIRCGIQSLLEICPSAEGTILMVCDQPYVTSTLLNSLIAAHQKTGKAIVACGYGDTFGPPVFFHHSLFEKLLQLKGDVGARGIIRQHTDSAEIISFPEGAYDVDTEADYERIKINGKS